ncbi:peptidylprolyl isomerase [Streptomyces sp. NPDC002886]|uniref:peptidylprolyl isomerase n=1 Tax=Streptomyces sp. NPDC002886 TaxID=3364667 RepID=UPI0036C1AE87
MLIITLRAATGAAVAAGLLAFATPAPSTVLVAHAAEPARTARAGECLYQPAKGQGTRNVGRPPAKPAYTGAVPVTLQTNLGAIGLSLDGGNAPCTVNSFTYLAGKNFFDTTNCHRLTTGALKVLQCGDPTATGSGGPTYRYGDENLPSPDPGKGTATYAKGTVAMANAGPGTNGSQFFLVYGDTVLPPNYTVFGKVDSGMAILRDVAKAGTDNSNGEGDGAPKKKITIQNVTIAR